jgi:transcriptional regulator with XRE-family HTH domain
MNALVQAHKERVGRRIKLARVSAGLSHDRLGAAVGTTRQHLIKLEKGLHMPGDGMLARIGEATGKPESYFLSVDDDEADPVTTDLLDVIRALLNNPGVRQVVRDAQRVSSTRVRSHA